MRALSEKAAKKEAKNNLQNSILLNQEEQKMKVGEEAVAVRTIEEILLDGEPYTSVVWSNQLSPFMAKFVPKLITKHNVAVTDKLPDKRYITNVKRLFNEYAHTAHKLGTSTTHLKVIKNPIKTFDYRPISLRKQEKKHENWIKSLMEIGRASWRERVYGRV